MIVLSFNACGVGGKSKINALKRLFFTSRPDFILVQETMCSGEKATLAYLALKI